ncbi:hypothetical protein HDU90_008110 [Geranomyces variabilis]|nr:hypothetical protein HDU90_008110 [Geranomyces variabilis]
MTTWRGPGTHQEGAGHPIGIPRLEKSRIPYGYPNRKQYGNVHGFRQEKAVGSKLEFFVSSPKKATAASLLRLKITEKPAHGISTGHGGGGPLDNDSGKARNRLRSVPLAINDTAFTVVDTAAAMDAKRVPQSPLGAQQQHIRDQSTVKAIDRQKLYPVYGQVERTILALNALIRNKVDWQKKVSNPTIVAKWKAELRASLGPRQNTEDEDAMLDEPLWERRLTELAATVENADDPSVREEDLTSPIQELRRFLEEQYAVRLSPAARSQLERMLVHCRRYKSRKDPRNRAHNLRATRLRRVQAGEDLFPRSPDQLLRENFSERLFDYVIKEAQAVAEYFDEDIVPAAVQGVYQADKSGDHEYMHDHKEALSAFVADLENVRDSDQDWHPGTDELVLDLVHPSLYCLEDGKTKVLPTETIDSPADSLRFINAGDVLPVKVNKPPENPAPLWSHHRPRDPEDEFQWLPTDVTITYSGHGTENRVQCEFQSYINNVHPVKQKAAYDVLAGILTRFVPMFNHVLTDLISEDETRIDSLQKGFYEDDSGDEGDQAKFAWGVRQHELDERSSGNDAGDGGGNESEAEEEEDEKWVEWQHERIIAYPTIPDDIVPVWLREGLVTYSTKDASSVIYPGNQWQVIVKIANIELTPEKPKYAGGSWHLEGTPREDIVATGIYYYSINNITSSRLSFQCAFDTDESADWPYEQDDHVGIQEVMGVVNSEPATQHLGAVEAVEGRCIVFPNTYQHKVEPFSLADPTRPGHRKILCFFLINPQNEAVLSTSKVPPQQSEWFWEEVRNTVPKMRTLPPEILAKVGHYVDSPTTLDQAKERRQRFMESRKAKAGVVDSQFYEDVSLCEH